METPKETERKIFDPKVYEFDTQPYTRVPEEFDSCRQDQDEEQEARKWTENINFILFNGLTL